MLTEKERRIVALKREGKTVREIANLTNSSFTTINDAWQKAEEEERLATEKKIKVEEEKDDSDRYTKALGLFSQGKSNIEVATSTGLKADEVISIRIDYWRLIRADELALLYNQNRRRLLSVLELDKRIKQEGVNEDNIVEALNHIGDLRSLREKIERRRARLRRLNDIILKAQDERRWLTRRRQRLEDRVARLREILKLINDPSQHNAPR